jgi:serine/threonine protein kinase
MGGELWKALLGHTNMIKFHDAFEDENNVYVVMEYVYILLRVNLSYKYDQIP